MEVLIISFITALSILGFRKAMEPGYILNFWAEIVESSEGLVKRLLTPLFLCEYCMSSIWTIGISLMFGQTNPIHIGIGILVTCGIVVYLQHERN
jgi:hypothetical protein